MLDIVIQHHPSRKRHLTLLRFLLGYSTHVEIITDEDSAASGMRKCFTYGASSGADALLILQDDILPCKDFLAAVLQIHKLRPYQLTSFFSAYSVVSETVRRGQAWATIDRLYGLCAYLIPMMFVTGYLSYEQRIKDDIVADDVRLSMFLDYLKEPAYLTCPSLVEHLAWGTTTTGSNRGNKLPKDLNMKYRIADDYIGFEQSALSIDWTAGLQNPAHLTIGQPTDFVRHTKPCLRSGA